MNQDLLNIIANFQLTEKPIKISPLNSGHINDTWKVTTQNHQSFVLQRINKNVFKEPSKMMENISRVLNHLKKKNTFPKTLTIIKTKDQSLFYEDDQKEYWRIYNFIENANSYDVVPSAKHTFEGAKGFGKFIKALADLPEPPLFETLPKFHDTAWRYQNFLKAIPTASEERLQKAGSLIKDAKKLTYLKSIILDLLDEGNIPYRVTHNDTKLNNALLDNESLETVAIIDLDTLMPGSVLYDFGDYVRSAARIGTEDEAELSKVSFSKEYFDAALEGFLASTADFLNKEEIKNLPISAAIITYEMGLRFLTDYLENDIFYKTSHPEQNLRRAAVQFKLINEMLSYFNTSSN